MSQNFNYENFRIINEQGNLIKYTRKFKRLPATSRDYFRKFFQKIIPIKNIVNDPIIYTIFKKQNYIFSILKFYKIQVYSGVKYLDFKFHEFRVLKRFGQFLMTRIANSGRILHLRKKNIKKKK
jgi:hypothetical protein